MSEFIAKMEKKGGYSHELFCKKSWKIQRRSYDTAQRTCFAHRAVRAYLSFQWSTFLVAQEKETIFEQAYGAASRQLSVPNRLDTKFHIASVTKMFIAMAALLLWEQGRLSLQEKPVAYVPELATLDKDITLHHLLSHTSGLEDIYEVPDLAFKEMV